MSGPRNHTAFERSLHVRAEIRRAWLELLRRRPFRRHTAEHVRRELPVEMRGMGDTAINWHLRALDSASLGDGDRLPTEQCADDSGAA